MTDNSLLHRVFFEEATFQRLSLFLKKRKPSTVVIICDTNTKKHCLGKLLSKVSVLRKAEIITIPNGEKNKNLDTAKKCWETLLQKRVGKDALIVALGGGMVTDVAGFVSTVYKRGMPFVFVPTSLLAIADAAIGGKNGLDFQGYKNILGTITMPKAVFIYPGFLRTLPERQLRNGYAEVIKSVLLGSRQLWKRVQNTICPDSYFLKELIAYSVKYKLGVVRKDPYESGLRKQLNFGHTIGHAIERYFLKKKDFLLHGEAIAWGMCIELCLGIILKVTGKDLAHKAILFLVAIYKLGNVDNALERDILEGVVQDKKNQGTKVFFSLIKSAGRPLPVRTAIPEDICEAIKMYNLIFRG